MTFREISKCFININEVLEPVFEEDLNEQDLAFLIWKGHLLGAI
jgi:hypothetical protein